MSIQRTVRLSQTVSPFGVGAIYDVLGESFVACDTTYWLNQGSVLTAPRLADALGVEDFRLAPARSGLFGADDGRGVPYYRFPQWLFCASCRRLERWSIKREEKGKPATCTACGSRRKLVPMRLVAICRESHLMDVPWDRWAHSNADGHGQKQCASPRLTFRTAKGQGGGLESLTVACATCDASRNLRGITGKSALKRIGIRCSGRQPWQASSKGVHCQESPQVVQRGASNVYFSSTPSAIDIPPHSSYSAFSDLTVQITNHPMWILLRDSPNGPIADHIVGTIAKELGCPESKVRQVLLHEGEDQPANIAAESQQEDLREGEWHAFLTPHSEQDDRDRFVTSSVEFLPADESGAAAHILHKLVDRVVLGTRLREVRALAGFSRLEPGNRIVPPDVGRGLPWLPAIEVYGEGIFVSFDEDALRSWETRADVQERVAVQEQRRRESFYANMLADPADARTVLLHTLAHLLIRQLAFDCGYSSASLRERIYTHVGRDGVQRAGFLVYTSAGDAEGTLGGLARQGEPPRLLNTFVGALRSAAWCSADPICIESPGQGVQALNLGACHACTLVSETSCVYLNALLDRGLVTGTPLQDVGFFSGVVDSVLDAAVEDWS